ncbi:hypothetical protein POSPLADRAFT_1046195 [Postia placenta MAD-698-R-SB12]|uniref:RING-type domain-containing protein n=1 Tax=Postia placenta MAD-698-R-SB12 TaxID=670580 RepID=A0A1X6N2D8_9APHY|nr:hypothetical protein POSPLADRAFT_1046195 [Postia placenta MAD-698-R-SB12]OSX62791.1 hypothetical protein POSPLADRAFT_1046195 [Postia placenta MAD-698-R-SB12]
MHFSKTYQQLLLTLPVELRDSAIEYRKLKKLINKVVNELNSIGLSPDVLQEVLGQGDISTTRTIRVNDHEVKVIYELSNVADHIEPRLRLIGSQEALGSPSSPRSASLPGALDAATDEESIAVTLPPGEGAGEDSTAVSVEEIITPSALSSLLQEIVAPDTHEIIIPLVSDTAFYQLLTQALQYLNAKLAVAIGENLLPIIPHIDDYACLICTNIAFKPIRLSCGHLFCVRCLVKMQKRGQGHCPMCRAPNVLSADRSNVDWALLNFMQDWFPVESKQKLRQNEKEVAEEEWEELGIEVGNCVVM